MEKNWCVSCGTSMSSSAMTIDVICGNCRGNINRGILSREYNYGHNSYSNLNFSISPELKSKKVKNEKHNR